MRVRRVRTCARFFQHLLLRLYPREFRSRHGDEWARFLSRQRLEDRYSHRFSGSLRYWVDIVLDSAAGALGYRLHAYSTDRISATLSTAAILCGLRAVARGLRRSPAFTLSITLILSLAIGATTAIYSLAGWALYRPVPGIVDHDRLVTVRFQTETRRGWFLVSHPDYLDLRQGAPALEALGASHRTQGHLARKGAVAARRVSLELVTADFFAALGVVPQLGTLPAGHQDWRQVLVSDRLWRSFFGADPAVVGTGVTINGETFTVTGVGPPDFRGPAVPQFVTDLWMPVEAHPAILPSYPSDILSRRSGTFYFNLYGKLRAGVEAAAAARQLLAVRSSLAADYGQESSLGSRLFPVVEPGVGLTPWARQRLTVTVRILSGVVALLLLMGCANTGNLLLARALSRRRELTLRRALGARRFQLALLPLTEGLALAIAGGVAGMAVAWGLLWLAQGRRLVANFPPIDAITLDGTVLMFALATTLATGLLFALAPALLAGRTPALSQDPRGGTIPGERLRGWLTAAQVGVSLSLLVGAGLLLKTLVAINAVPLGIDPGNVLEATIDPRTQGYSEQRLMSFWEQLRESTLAVADVGSAGLAWAPLYGGIGTGARVSATGAPEEDFLSTYNNYVTQGFVGAVGLPLLAGRDFLASEVMREPPADVAIVSETLARELFPEGGGIGRMLTLRGRPPRTVTVVGIVGDARLKNLKEDSPYVLLEPFGQGWTPGWATLYVGGGGRNLRLVENLEAVVASLDPSLPLYDVQALSSRIGDSTAEERALATITALLAGLALTLAGAGLYGIMSYRVALRQREIGIRIALGAPTAAVGRMVIGEGIIQAALGIPAGLGLGWVVSRLVAHRLWRVEAIDVSVFVIAALVLVAVAAFSSWLIARRAVRLDAMRTLTSPQN